MKTIGYLFLAVLMVAPNFASGSESVKSGIKKAKNRVKEATCTDSDLECKAKKAGHRVGEGADKIENKAEQKKDKVN